MSGKGTEVISQMGTPQFTCTAEEWAKLFWTHMSNVHYFWASRQWQPLKASLVLARVNDSFSSPLEMKPLMAHAWKWQWMPNSTRWKRDLEIMQTCWGRGRLWLRQSSFVKQPETNFFQDQVWLWIRIMNKNSRIAILTICCCSNDILQYQVLFLTWLYLLNHYFTPLFSRL